MARALDRVSINILGVNTVSRRLVESLRSIGARVRAIDHPGLRNMRLFRADERLIRDAWTALEPEAYDAWEESLPTGATVCLVVCSDFGGLQGLAEWNALAYARGWHFLPVVLQNAIGLVGPFVIPGETACFQCLLARENANLPDAAIKRATETFAFEGQLVAAYHPSMASALGDVAAIELTKQYGYGWPSTAIGNAIELNLLSASMRTRPIFKAPGCTVCSPLNLRGRLELSREALQRS
jgi:thiazole/oxazole-forming peptide maturase SagC family component